MRDHEVVCALAASGQLDACEKAEFDEHCKECRACRDELEDLAWIGAGLRLEAVRQAVPASLPAGSLERFRARAMREGIVPRTGSSRASTSYALASVAAMFLLAAGMMLVPRGRDVGPDVALSATPSVVVPRSVRVGVGGGTPMARGAKVMRARSARHLVVRRDAEVRDASLIGQRFPEAMGASYPFFGAQGAAKVSSSRYPALSSSQMSRLSLFRTLDPSGSRTPGSAGSDRPINIAVAGNVFDFAADVWQLHFQIPTAQ